MRRSRLLVGALGVLAAASGLVAGSTPATAAGVDALDGFVAERAGQGSNLTLVQIVPPEIKRYEWVIVAYKRTPRSKTQLVIRFIRTGAQNTQLQTSEFGWALSRRALRVDARDLKPASLQTGKGMGNNGLVDMTLTRTEGYTRIPAEEGCTGAVSFRVGRFAGRFRFNARDDYFGRISMRRVPVLVYREHDYRCRDDSPPPPECPEDLLLAATGSESDATITADKTPEGRVEQKIVVSRALDTGQAVHTISVGLAVPEAFEASDDLTSANVDGDAAGPWLSGDLSFVGPPASESEDEDCGPYQSSSGLATGDYTAHFDSIGDVTPATTGLPATLRREI